MQKIFRKNLTVIGKIKKRSYENFTFFLRNYNLPTKIYLTAVNPLQHIRVTRKQSQFHNQNHKNTRSLGGEI